MCGFTAQQSKFRKRSGITISLFYKLYCQYLHRLPTSNNFFQVRAINDSSKSRRSVRPNGPRLRMLRLSAGLTQEELATLTDYSDRVIRKAEKGERVDLRTIRELKRFFESTGALLQANDRIITEMPLAKKSLSEIWFEHAFHQRNVTVALSLLHDDCELYVEGVQICSRKIESFLQALCDLFVDFKYVFDYQAATDPWCVLGWRSTRQLATCNPSNQTGTVLICGITSFRIQRQRIVEVHEYSNTESSHNAYRNLLHLHSVVKTRG